VFGAKQPFVSATVVDWPGETVEGVAVPVDTVSRPQANGVAVVLAVVLVGTVVEVVEVDVVDVVDVVVDVDVVDPGTIKVDVEVELLGPALVDGDEVGDVDGSV
jgi:hypothetical protein